MMKFPSDLTKLTTLELIELAAHCEVQIYHSPPSTLLEIAVWVEGWTKRMDTLKDEARRRDAQPAPQAEAGPQPDWSQAPEWAMWWAMDEDLEAYWYENEPDEELTQWNAEGKLSMAIPWRGWWKMLKRRRPGPQGPEP